MIKKACIFALIVSLFLTLLSPGLVQAQGELRILDSSAKAELPFQLYFNLSAEGDANIIDIRLHYTVDQESYAQVNSEVYIEFVPNTTVDVQWIWDMRKTGGLPPGSSVEFWWTVKDVKGNKVETTPARVRFDDNRYSWQNLSEGKLTIYWYEGDKSFAEEIMLAAQQALSRLAEDTGAELKKSVKLYVYASAQDLLGAMIFPQEWTGGVAFPRYSIIAIGIGPDDLVWGRRAIAHELTHLVIDQMTFNPYAGLPVWLNEGLAMYSEGALDAVFTASLKKSIAEKSLISARSLSSPFSAYAGEASLAYAESYSLVEFLVGHYGQTKMLGLLNTFSEGSSYDRALERVYGFDTEGLNTLWQDYVGSLVQPGVERETHPALIAALAGLAAALLLALSLVVENWAWKRDW